MFHHYPTYMLRSDVCNHSNHWYIVTPLLDADLLIAGAAAIGFSVIFVLFVPLRTYVIPRLSFTQEELFILDGPTSATSSFVTISLPLLTHKLMCSTQKNGMKMLVNFYE